MKKITTLLTIVLLQTATLFAVNENDTLSKQKQCFYDAKTELENMLSGKIPPDYERAVFITENAYLSNKINYSVYKKTIDVYVENIKKLAEANRNESLQNFKATLLETEVQKREKYQNSLYNWAIYTYITDTVYTLSDNKIFVNIPSIYSYKDPLGTLDWNNSQVLNLLDFNKRTGNCYAMTSFFKILSERLKTEASIGVAPGHVYITHIDQKGTHYNIELANRAFPGAGSIMTLTYTPIEAVRNGIAMRTLDLKQSVALCLIYLAKGYEHKFDTKTDDFLYKCAETTLKYDSLNLNAMLLKAEVLEEKIVKSNKSVSQLQTEKEFKEYQNLIVSLFNKGYREMPLDQKNLIINRLQKDSLGLILTDHTPRGFQTINPKDDRYATLSWGMFDEIHEPKLIEQYGRTLLNTKTKKITKFVTVDSLYNKYPIDPVVFAWQIDPLTSKYPNMSPYAAFNNNPIYFVDPSGESGVAYKTEQKNEKTGHLIIKVVSNMYIYGQDANETTRAAIQSQSDAQWNNGGNYYTYTDDAGTIYDVVFEFKTEIIDAKDVDAKMTEGDYFNLNAENNFYEVRDDVSESQCLSRGVIGGNAGVIKTSDIDKQSVGHEENHGFYGTNKDASTIQENTNPDISVTQGNTSNPSSRKVKQENINAIFNNVKFDKNGKGNVGNARPFKWDKDAPKNSVQIPKN